MVNTRRWSVYWLVAHWESPDQINRRRLGSEPRLGRIKGIRAVVGGAFFARSVPILNWYYSVAAGGVLCQSRKQRNYSAAAETSSGATSRLPARAPTNPLAGSSIAGSAVGAGGSQG